MTNAKILLDEMKAKAGGGEALARYLYGDHIANPLRKYDSLSLQASKGHIIQRFEFKVRSFCAVHNIPLTDDVFLTERQRKERAGATA